MMFEESVPKWKIGALVPLPVIDYQPYEFYRLAPPGALLVSIAVGLTEFSAADVERVFKPIRSYIDQLVDRDVDIVTLNGVPLQILVGVEAHDRILALMAEHSGKPATSTVLAVCHGARELGIRKLALVNKWSEPMNRTLAAFFAREGVAITGTATREFAPRQAMKIGAKDGMVMAYELGRKAFLDNPDCDAIHIGGSAWLSEPVAQELEREFGKPVISNQSAMTRHALKMIGAWRPVSGQCRLLATP